jgi:hypothetical protein
MNMAYMDRGLEEVLSTYICEQECWGSVLFWLVCTCMHMVHGSVKSACISRLSAPRYIWPASSRSIGMYVA